MKKLLAIINPKSGTDNKAGVPELIDKIIDKTRFQVDLRWVEKFGDAKRFGQEAVEKGYDGAIAIGGDGTVNGVATALINSPVAMAVV
ncbi:MAG: acylglycerol kinase family protein, partial [Muribaculaceae bacterium]|nr:acylglycerol kinase family protein [Muribaculaceae bacterium]